MVLGACVSWELVTIRAGWEVLLEVGAGTGSVYLLRWYWWRINAWSEIAAMTTALVVSLAIRWTAPFHGSEPAVFAKQTLVTTLITTAAWVIVTILTPAEPRETLLRFYRRVRPDASGWQPIAQLATDIVPTEDLGRNLLDWIAGCAMVYIVLCSASERSACFPGDPEFYFARLSVICAAFLYRGLSRVSGAS